MRRREEVENEETKTQKTMQNKNRIMVRDSENLQKKKIMKGKQRKSYIIGN